MPELVGISILSGADQHCNYLSALLIVGDHLRRGSADFQLCAHLLDLRCMPFKTGSEGYLATLRMRHPILAFGEIARVDIFKFKPTVAFRRDRTDGRKCGRETGRRFNRVGFKWNA